MKALYLFLLFSIAFALGDCNGDNATTSLDALLALKMSIGKLAFDPCADVDGDGVITAVDALKILKIATGEEDELFNRIKEAVKWYDPEPLLNSSYGWVIDKFGNERVEVHISRKNGKELVIGVVLEKGYIKEFRKGGLEKKSMLVYADEEFVREMLRKPSFELLREGIESGRVNIKGVGLLGLIKSRLISRAFSLFGK